MLLLLYCLSAQVQRFLFVPLFLYRMGVKLYLYLCLPLSLSTSCPFTGYPEKSLASSSLHPPSRCSYTLRRFLWAFSSPDWAVPAASSLSSNARCSSPFLALHSWHRITSLSLLAALSLMQPRVILSAKVHLMFNIVSTRTPNLQSSVHPGAPSACTGAWCCSYPGAELGILRNFMKSLFFFFWPGKAGAGDSWALVQAVILWFWDKSLSAWFPACWGPRVAAHSSGLSATSPGFVFFSNLLRVCGGWFWRHFLGFFILNVFCK